MVKKRIFTSYFAKMAKRSKGADDVYIAVSRTCFCPLRSLNGRTVEDEVDYHFPDLGNLWGLSEYKKEVNREDVKLLADLLNADWELDDPNSEGVNIFLLCFENLNAKYTKADEARYDDVRAGEYKKCHRTLLAEILEEEFGVTSSEYVGGEEL